MKFFYYSEREEEEARLASLFERSLAEIVQGLEDSKLESRSRTSVVLRLRQFVSKRSSFAAEIAAARKKTESPQHYGPEAFTLLQETFEHMLTEFHDLKARVIAALNSGQMYPSKECNGYDALNTKQSINFPSVFTCVCT